MQLISLIILSINVPTTLHLIFTTTNSLLNLSKHHHFFKLSSSPNMMNNKYKKSQILMLSLLAALLFITPLLSSSLRPTYLYFITNLLIVALGVEAGLLSVFFSKPPEDKRPAVSVASKPAVVATTPEASANDNPSEGEEKKGRVVEKAASEKIPRGVKVERVRKCPSTPSLFFIGSGETDHQAEEQVGYEKFNEEEAEEEEVGGGLSGQELFNKAESFIGNFYKQLKMQREESWKRIHGFYQKAF